jgi:hypothetical protein
MPVQVKIFIALAIIPGLTMLSRGVSHWESAGLGTSLLVLPIAYSIYLRYRIHLQRQVAREHVKP